MNKEEWDKVSKNRSFVRLANATEAILESTFPEKDVKPLWAEIMGLIIKNTRLDDYKEISSGN